MLAWMNVLSRARSGGARSGRRVREASSSDVPRAPVDDPPHRESERRWTGRGALGGASNRALRGASRAPHRVLVEQATQQGSPRLDAGGGDGSDPSRWRRRRRRASGIRRAIATRTARSRRSKGRAASRSTPRATTRESRRTTASSPNRSRSGRRRPTITRTRALHPGALRHASEDAGADLQAHDEARDHPRRAIPARSRSDRRADSLGACRLRTWGS